MDILITDVTEMGGGNYCVAGWDIAARRMVRPLPNARNWTGALLGQHGISPGKLVRVEPQGTSNGIYPHLTEDTPIALASIKTSTKLFSDWLGASAPSVATDLSTGFDGHLQWNSEWNGVKQGVHTQPGTQCPSWVAVRIEKASLSFANPFDKLNGCSMTDQRPINLRFRTRRSKRHGAEAAWRRSTMRFPRGMSSRPGGVGAAVWQSSEMFCDVERRLVKRIGVIMVPERTEVFTVGHSTHSWERFVALLSAANVTAIADVRSSPYSRHFPHFNRDELRAGLGTDGISYVFLGKELGGRPNERRFYCEGIADYEKMAQASEFSKGLDRVIEGAKKYRIALMCSERDPLDCHRCLLVGRALARGAIRVSHILDNGRVVDHAEIEDRLLELSGRNADDLFASRSERLAAAYRERARKVAFAEPQADPRSPMTAE